MILTEVITVLLLVLSGVCAISDFRTHRIPNVLVCSGALLCLVFQILSGGLAGLLSYVLGLSLSFLIFFILYRMHVIGAGDVKMFSVIGSYFGTHCLKAFLLILVIGAFYSLGMLLYHRQFLRRLKHLFSHVKSDLILRTITPYDDSDKEEKLIVPLAVPAFAGLLAMALAGLR